MKFLVDAQLPRALVAALRSLGHEAIHTSELPEGNATADEEIRRLARVNGMVVVSKDDDFVNSHILRGDPAKLLFIATGNITNQDLLAILRRHSDEIAWAFADSVFVELNRTSLVVHS
jgi:predicted nuclease of predicted toxin-antitoxin system